MSVLDDLSNLGDRVSTQLGRAAADTTVTIETSIFPTLEINVGAQLADTSPPGFLTRLLAPKVTVKSPSGTLFTAAPAGDPKDADLAPLFLFGLALVVLGVVGWRVIR